MRVLISTALAATLVGSAAFGAETNAPLSPGKPAGTRAAQLDVTNTAVIATTAVILVTALVLGVTQKGYPSSATTTSTSQ
jgi:hypothetical protein